MQVVRRADVDDVDVVGSDQLVRAREGALGPEVACGPLALSGRSAATPASCAPASRAERAWTPPMNPAPITPARSAVGVGALPATCGSSAIEPLSLDTAANLFHFCMFVKQKLRG